MITKEKKTKLIEKYRRSATDTGSAEVQVAMLTERINELTSHLQSHVKDHSGRRGLLMLVSKRRRLLNYLRQSDEKRYLDLIGGLQLRK